MSPGEFGLSAEAASELDRGAGKARSVGRAGGRGTEARQHDDGDDQHQVGQKRCKRIRHRYVFKTEWKMAEHAQKTLITFDVEEENTGL